MSEFKQLCVWPGTTCGEEKEEELVDWFKSEFNARIKYEGCMITSPDKDEYGKPVKNTGGRSDLFFYVHNNDISHFAVPRLSLGVRWWEDVILNGSHLVYSNDVLEKYSTTW